MNCEGCDKPIDPSNDYHISVVEVPSIGFFGGVLLQFCSWYCASSIINEKASEEREAEKASA